MSDLDMPPRIDGELRSYQEMHFYLGVHGCPSCDSRDFGSPESDWYRTEDRSAGHFDVTCPQCGARRRVAFFTAPHFPQSREIASWQLPERLAFFHLGGAAPSTILSPHEFAAELRRCERLVVPSFTALAPEEFVAQRGNIRCAMSSVLELRKFIPPGGNRVPDAACRTDAARAYRAQHPDQFLLDYVEREIAKWMALDAAGVVEFERRSGRPPTGAAEREPMAQPMSSLSLKLHAAWLDGRGGEQLRAVGVDAPVRALIGARFDRAVLDNVTLEEASLGLSSWERAKLASCRLRAANFTDATLVDADLAGCDLTAVYALRVVLEIARVQDCTFDRAELGGASLRHSRFARCTFAGARLKNADLERTHFVDCNLRHADLSVLGSLPARPASAASEPGTVFVRCDLRNTSWTGRDQSKITFIDCQLEGATGLTAAATLDVALDRDATFEEAVAALRATGLSEEEAYHAVIDPSRVDKPRRP